MSRTGAAPPLAAEGLHKRFGGRTAVERIDLAIAPGEVVGLLGPNGAGKTTTVKMLLGLVRPDSGRAHLFGLPAADPRARRAVGYLPETFAQPEWATGVQVLASHTRLVGLAPTERDVAIEQALHTVGLAGRGGDRVGGYSKGMRQRLGLAVALIGSPGLVVLDEPTSAMDPIGRREVRDVVRGLAAAGTAVLLNSHLLAEVEAVCDRIVVMHRGRVLADRAVADLPTGGEVRITADHLDAEHLAVIEGHGVVGHHDDRTAVVALDDGEALPEMVAALVRAGASLRAVVPLQSSLEELFVRLVDDDDLAARAAAGEAAR